MIKVLGYSVFGILATGIIGLVLFPLSFAMDTLQKEVPAVSYSSVKGSVWNGRVGGVKYGYERIGTVSLSTEWSSLLSGQWLANLTVKDGSVTAIGQVGAKLTGEAFLKDVRVRGRTSDLTSLKEEYRTIDGEFSFNLAEFVVKENRCVTGSGTVWTDILHGFSQEYNWEGPELSGPITCENGDVVIRLGGDSIAGEKITTELKLSLSGFGGFVAKIDNPTPEVAEATTFLGFLYQDGSMIYRQSITPAGSGASS